MERISITLSKLNLRWTDFVLVTVVTGASFWLSWLGLCHLPKNITLIEEALSDILPMIYGLAIFSCTRKAIRYSERFGRISRLLTRFGQFCVNSVVLASLCFLGVTASSSYKYSVELLEHLKSECLGGENTHKCYEAATIAQFRKDLRTAAEFYARACPNSPKGCNDGAWALTEIPDLKALEREEALNLALKAVTAEPEEANFLDTYAATLTLNGRHSEAVAAEERAIALLMKSGSRDHISKKADAFETRLRLYQTRAPAALSDQPSNRPPSSTETGLKETTSPVQLSYQCSLRAEDGSGMEMPMKGKSCDEREYPSMIAQFCSRNERHQGYYLDKVECLPSRASCHRTYISQLQKCPDQKGIKTPLPVDANRDRPTAKKMVEADAREKQNELFQVQLKAQFEKTRKT